MAKYVRIINNGPNADHPLLHNKVVEGEDYEVVGTYEGGGCVIVDEMKRSQSVTPKLYDDVELIEK